MKARLVQLEGTRRADSVKLGRSAEITIGRDPDCDLIIDRLEVSRVHAIVSRDGDRHLVADAHSANGTFVNGERVGAEPVPLASGDRIEIAGGIALLYEQVADSGLSRSAFAGLAAAALGVLAVGAAVWWLAVRDPLLDEATSIAARGQNAALAGDAEAAKDHFREAAGLLFRHGYLDDVARGDVMRVAMDRLGARLPGQPALWATFQRVLEETSRVVEDARPVARQCVLDKVSARRLPACLREHVDLVLARLHQRGADAPEDFATEVGQRMRIEHRSIEVALVRGAKLVPMLTAELEKAHLPAILQYVAMIESGYDVDAISPEAAAGLWQLMPATARNYGLHVGPERDERRDAFKSTRAAAKYLRDLTFEFGGDALLLALAGYNRGENGVRRALKKLDDPFRDRSYWRLVERQLLPEETRKYVTRFVASAVAGEAGLPSRKDLVDAGY